MRKLIAIAILSILMLGCKDNSSPAKPFTGWRELTVTGSPKTGQIHILYDPSSVRREGDIAQVWELDNFEQPQSNALGNYLSAKSLREYNCNTNETRLVSFTVFSENDGKGNIVTSSATTPNWISKPSPIEPNSMASIFPPIVCK
jgi:hypothetical protein